jgi:hypothetical protein
VWIVQVLILAAVEQATYDPPNSAQSSSDLARKDQYYARQYRKPSRKDLKQQSPGVWIDVGEHRLSAGER